MLDSHARITAGDAADGQRRQFAMHAAVRKSGLDQPLHRRVGYRQRRFGIGRLALRQVIHAVARPRQAARFHLPANACPDPIGQHALLEDQRFQHRVAGFRRLDQRQPERHGVVEHGLIAACVPALQRVARYFLIRLHHGREFGVELGPQLILAQFLQPVAAHALGDVASLVAREEGLDRRRIGVLSLQIDLEQPVVDVGIQCVTLHLGRDPFELGAVAEARGIACGEQEIVGSCCAMGQKNRDNEGGDEAD